MESWSVAVATARGKLVGRQEYCSCGRQLPERRRGRGGEGGEYRRGEGGEYRRGEGVERRRGEGMERRRGEGGERRKGGRGEEDGRKKKTREGGGERVGEREGKVSVRVEASPDYLGGIETRVTV